MMNHRILLYLILTFLTFQPMSAQMDYYIYLQDADGNPITGATLEAFQQNESVEALYQEAPISAFQVKIEQNEALQLHISHPDYTFQEALSFPAPLPPYAIKVSGGKPGDSYFTIGDQRFYYPNMPITLAVRPHTNTWQNQDQLQKLLDLAKQQGLEAIPSPWPEESIGLDELDQLEPTYYFRYPKNFKPDPFQDPAIEALRKSQLNQWVGIALRKDLILGHHLMTFSQREVSTTWLKEENLTLSHLPSPLAGGNAANISINASLGCGIGILKLLSEAQKVETFSQTTLEFYH